MELRSVRTTTNADDADDRSMEITEQEGLVEGLENGEDVVEGPDRTVFGILHQIAVGYKYTAMFMLMTMIFVTQLTTAIFSNLDNDSKDNKTTMDFDMTKKLMKKAANFLFKNFIKMQNISSNGSTLI